MRQSRLTRRLGTFDAVVVGLGAMLGAGVFTVWAPAAAAAGPGLLVGLLVAAVVAYANADSSARLAALYPESGGTYVYGKRRLGDFWGYLAGWCFVVGKTASCAAMALTVGAYLAPDHARWVGAGAVVVLTALDYRGVQKSAFVTRLIVAITLVVLGFAGYALLRAPVVGPAVAAPAGIEAAIGTGADVYGVLQAAGLIFFAFAGYARIATLGEEVRDPHRTLPRAIPIALGIVLVVYALVGFGLLSVLGPSALAGSTAPLVAAVSVSAVAELTWIVQAGAAIAALGALLALILGVSRTTFAMARDRHLPAALDAVHPRFGVPHHAELAVGGLVVVVVLLVDLRGAIGFSSFGVLLYYALANASAWTLGARRLVPAVGVIGCVVLAFALPWTAVLPGSVVLVLGALVWMVWHRPRSARR